MALSRSALTGPYSMRALSSTVLQPSILALQYRSLSTSPILQDTKSSSKSTASFTRAKTAEPVSSNSSSTSTTAQSSGNAPARTGYNAVAKAESKLAKQQKGMSRQMPGMSLENQDQPLAGESWMSCTDLLSKVALYSLSKIYSATLTSAG
jgi:hypothetical protein